MLCENIPPVEGGIENHIHCLVKELGNNCRIFLLVSNLPKGVPAYEKRGNVEIHRLTTNGLVILIRDCFLFLDKLQFLGNCSS